MITQIHDLWRYRPQKMIWTSIAAMAMGMVTAWMFMSWLNIGPAVTIRPGIHSVVFVSGIEVSVDVDATRKLVACPGAYAIRRMIRYKPDGSWDGVAFIQEHDLAAEEIGSRKYTLHLHLYSPLQGDGWFYSAEIYDGCGLLPDLFKRRPSMAPPVRVNIA